MPLAPVRRYTFDRVVRLIIGLVIVAALLLATAYLSDVLIPFAIAFLLAYLLNPLVNLVQRGVRSRVAAIILTMVLAVSLCVGATVVLVPMIVEQGQHLFQQLHKIAQDKQLAAKARECLPDNWWQACSDFLKREDVAECLGNPQAGKNAAAPTLEAPAADKQTAGDKLAPANAALQAAQQAPAPDAVPAPHDDAPLDDASGTAAAPPASQQEGSWWENATGFFSDPQLSGYLSSERFLGYVRAALARVAPIAASVFTGVYSGIVAVIVGLAAAAMVMMYLFFILKDYERVSSGWQQLIPPDQRELIIGFVSDFNVYMNRYFRNQAIIAFFSTIIMSVGFSVIGLPMGILLGIFCGVLSMVPYLQAVGFVPAAILALICALDTGVSFWWVAGEVALVFIVAQLAYDLVLVPRFMGEATGLSPAIILLSLSVWGKFLGLLGFLIALPMTCLLLAYYQRMIARPAEAAPPPPSAPPVASVPVAPVAPAPAPTTEPEKGEPHART